MPSKIARRIILLLAMVIFPVSGWACESIQEANDQTKKKLSGQQDLLQQLQTNVSSLELSCNQKETLISQRGANSATAASCVALRENAAMTKALTQTSQACSANIDTIRSQLDQLTTSYIAPEEEELGSTVSLDGKLKTLQKFCGKEMAQTRELSNSATDLLSASRAAVTKATEAVQNFTAMGAKTQQFSQTSQAEQERCNIASSGDSQNQNRVAAHGQGVSQAKIPGGHSAQNESTVTGRLNDQGLPDPSSTSKLGAPGRRPATLNSDSVAQSIKQQPSDLSGRSSSNSSADASKQPKLSDGSIMSSSRAGHTSGVSGNNNPLNPHDHLASSKSGQEPGARGDNAPSGSEEMLVQDMLKAKENSHGENGTTVAAQNSTVELLLLAQMRQSSSENNQSSTSDNVIDVSLFDRVHQVLRRSSFKL